MQYQIAVTEAAHNVVLLHLLRCMGPMLEQNVRQNFELLYSRREMLAKVSSHRAGIFEAIVAREPEKAREASHRHLAFIEEILLISAGSILGARDRYGVSSNARIKNCPLQGTPACGVKFEVLS